MTPYYQDEYATIYHGNCDVKKADIIVVDPPDLLYDIGSYNYKVLYVFCGHYFHFYQDQLGIGKEWWWTCRHYGNGQMVKTKEPIAIFGKASPENNSPYYIPTIRQHRWERPVELMYDLIYTVKGDVLDPFMGTGSALVAAKGLNRKCVGYDIEEKYCEIAAKRLEEF